VKLLTAIALTTTLSISSFSVHAGSRRSGVDPSPDLKRQLRGLVTAQEGYWANHGTYTTDVAALGVFKPRRPPTTPADSVWLQVIQAGGRSWWGRAVYLGQRDRSCVIYVGTTADFTAPPTTDGAQVKAHDEGAPVCDTF